VELAGDPPRPAASPRLIGRRGDEVRVTVAFGSGNRVGHVTLAPWDVWPPEPVAPAVLVEGIEAASFAVDASFEDHLALLVIDAGLARFAPRVPLGSPEPGPIHNILWDDLPPATRAVFARRIGEARHAIGFEHPGDYSGPTAPVTYELAAGAIDHTDPDAPAIAPWPSVHSCDDAPPIGDALRVEGRWLLALGSPLGDCLDDVPPPGYDAIEITSFDEGGQQYFGTEIPLAGTVTHLALARRPDGAWIAWRSAGEGIRAAQMPDSATSASAPVTVVDAVDVPLSMAAEPLGAALGLAWVEDPAGNPADVVAAVAGAEGGVARAAAAVNRAATGPIALAASPERRALLVAWEEIFEDGAPGIFLARLVCVGE
jgi:hypothetical protein